jgi:hypothetical protein
MLYPCIPHKESMKAIEKVITKKKVRGQVHEKNEGGGGIR